MEEPLKYFQPDISELLEGYEFEYQEYDEDKDEFKDNWIKSRFDSRSGLGHDLTHQFLDGKVRCKFLTKEQIEAEGWKFIHSSSWETGDLIGFEKDDWIISYNLKTKVINIRFKDTSIWNREAYGPLTYSYIGPCKDINIFRQICKLYNIC